MLPKGEPSDTHLQGNLCHISILLPGNLEANTLFLFLKLQSLRNLRKDAHRNILDFLDCNYLPSVNDPVPCYYQPVTCDPPPNVTNARIINGFQYNGTYLAKFQVEYECVDETFQMEGNSTVTCLYSGEWYKLPKCLKRKSETLNLLINVLPLFIANILHFYNYMYSKKKICLEKEENKEITFVEEKQGI